MTKIAVIWIPWFQPLNVYFVVDTILFVFTTVAQPIIILFRIAITAVAGEVVSDSSVYLRF